jgi:hypothetical protein
MVFDTGIYLPVLLAADQRKAATKTIFVGGKGG